MQIKILARHSLIHRRAIFSIKEDNFNKGLNAFKTVAIYVHLAPAHCLWLADARNGGLSSSEAAYMLSAGPKPV